jgi:hypothetical protein
MTPGITLSGGPTALLEVGGVRLLTDPTFDPAGDHPAGEHVLVKTEDSVLTEEAVGVVDVLREAFEAAGPADRLVLLEPGERAEV